MSGLGNAHPADFAHGLMFHRFHRAGSRPFGQGSLSDEMLDRLIEHVGVGRLLDPDEWISRTREGRLEQHHCCITFDDGLASQQAVALPVLEAHGLKAFWFVFSSVFEGGIDKNELYNGFATRYFESFGDFVDEFLAACDLPRSCFETDRFLRYRASMGSRFPFYDEHDIRYRFVRNFVLSEEAFGSAMDRCMAERGVSLGDLAEGTWMTDSDLATLVSKGHHVGLHSYSHPFVLADVPLEAQAAEYQRNFEHVARATGREPLSMSHPLGSYGHETLQLLSALGIEVGFRSSPVAVLPEFSAQHLALQQPRIDSTVAIACC